MGEKRLGCRSRGTFGIGEHFCMGAHLARFELETIFWHLLTRLESFELAGQPARRDRP